MKVSNVFSTPDLNLPLQLVSSSSKEARKVEQHQVKEGEKEKVVHLLLLPPPGGGGHAVQTNQSMAEVPPWQGPYSLNLGTLHLGRTQDSRSPK